MISARVTHLPVLSVLNGPFDLLEETLKLLAVNELEYVIGAGDLLPPGTPSNSYMPSSPGGSYTVGQSTIYVAGGNIYIYSGYSYAY
jgi:hypothetical protein